MLVRAKRLGYLGHKRIKPGQEFVLRPKKGFAQDKDHRKLIEKEFSAEDQFSEVWMEKVEEEDTKPKKGFGKKKSEAEVVDVSEPEDEVI